MGNLPSGAFTLVSNGTCTTASFSCENGYYLEGPSEIVCLPDGTWENDAPTCSMYALFSSSLN